MAIDVRAVGVEGWGGRGGGLGEGSSELEAWRWAELSNWLTLLLRVGADERENGIASSQETVVKQI